MSWVIFCWSAVIILKMTHAVWIPGCHKVVAIQVEPQEIHTIDAFCSPSKQPSNHQTNQQESNIHNSQVSVSRTESFENTAQAKDTRRGGYIILPTNSTEYPWKSYFIPLLNLPLEGLNLRELMDNNTDAKPRSLANNERSSAANPGFEEQLLSQIHLIRQHLAQLSTRQDSGASYSTDI